MILRVRRYSYPGAVWISIRNSFSQEFEAGIMANEFLRVNLGLFMCGCRG